MITALNDQIKKTKKLDHIFKQGNNILAAFLVKQGDNISVVSLGVGHTCLPDSIIAESPDDVLHDHHAEILAKRGLVRFLVDEIEKLDSSIDYLSLILQKNSGAASMEKFKQHDLRGDIPSSSFVKRGRSSWDDLQSLRTKPGRVDSPFSSCMSCSDKIGLWNLLGIQSELLYPLTGPIFVDHIVIGCEIDNDIFMFSIFGRFKTEVELLGREISFRIPGVKSVSSSQCVCPHNDNLVFSSLSANWYIGVELEITTSIGRKLGAAKKQGEYPKSTRSRLCRSSIRDKVNAVLSGKSLISIANEYTLGKALIRSKGDLMRHWLIRDSSKQIDL
ncbi:Adenosine deaminase/editase domain-containing protein [Rozella allomycis CSF55]|uniref:Adenosine deaminase/editase domain-containing protein n=1 Tax=Rozella allomycis (strain CSF55) TaxID=988480 RepID=A0A075B4I9_ROZAC|nr:Adenosine deaminase/editase domain-containing protein [Rozella allomycis CSF55]|eukprot:EPZ36392.1 Adenosine deaminase/editase domain-containing protein [Rozella allomycis CSF55]